MRRSELEAAIDGALALAEEHRMPLPPFAHWSRDEWLARPPGSQDAVERGLGWDVTDFGRGDFARVGLCLCTLRNGTLAERDAGRGQTYAEKLLVVQPGQETPFHLHRRKTEDIVNRGGGVLVAELHPAEDGQLGDGTARTLVDGLGRELAAGERVDLRPGSGIQVPAGVFHRFWAEDAVVLATEVSGVNDDADDNLFLEDGGRYPQLVEDVPARRLTVGEYGLLG